MSSVRIGILGTGSMGAAHVRRLVGNPEVEVVALCDTNDESITHCLAETWPDDREAPATYRDADRMYKEARLDGVVVVTPHTLHFEHAAQALEAGCHVLLEKPMVTKVDDAYRLADIVEKSGKILSIGYNTSSMPAVAYVRDAIRDQSLGPLRLASGYILQSWMIPMTGKWRQNPEWSGGGMAYDSGAHLLNTICWTIDSPVAEVFAYVDKRGRPVDVDSMITIVFENGVYTNVMIGGNCPTSSSCVVYVMENGKIELDGWSGEEIRVWKEREEIKGLDFGDEVSPDQNFIDSILGRAQPPTTAQHGIILSELMDAIYASAASGTTIRPRSDA